MNTFSPSSTSLSSTILPFPSHSKNSIFCVTRFKGNTNQFGFSKNTLLQLKSKIIACSSPQDAGSGEITPKFVFFLSFVLYTCYFVYWVSLIWFKIETLPLIWYKSTFFFWNQQLLHYWGTRNCSGFCSDASAGNSRQHKEQAQQNLSSHGRG